MKTKNIILYLTGSLVLFSCQDMFEPADENTRQEDAMYVESEYAHGLLVNAYSRLPYITTCQTDVATDDAVTNDLSSNYYLMSTSAWKDDFNPVSVWDNCKHGIQYANKFLQIVEKVSWAPSAASKQQMFIDRLKGEAYGLRALFYFYLLQGHGGYADDGVLYGVPLLTKPEDGSSDFNQPRATFADCVKQCFADCDSAMALLPLDYVDIDNNDDIPAKYRELGANYSNYNLVCGKKAKNLLSGRAAEAIKAQVALLAASPAFRDQSGVTSAEAAQLCANVLNRINGLEGFDPTGNVWYKNKTKIDNNTDMAEILWREDRGSDTSQEGDNFPPTLYGKGRVNPSQNFVDAFPMLSGLPITAEGSGYDPQDPYANRDPRLDNYVILNGTTYKRSVIISGNYPYVNEAGLAEYDDNIGYGSTSTRTGYYMKKLLRDDVMLGSSTAARYHIYPRIRYTEIFLDYAEAANDAWGPKADPNGNGYTAYDIIKAIRERAGLGKDMYGAPLPQGDAYLEVCAADQTTMTNLIRNERRIELSFENKRFWDLRRWLLPLDEPIKGMQIDRDEATQELTYTIIDVEDRKFDNSYQCYGPIPRGEVLKWSKLKQNKGW